MIGNSELQERMAEQLPQTPEALATENAKLRELLRIAVEHCINGYSAEEDECPLYESRHSCRLQAEARELGSGGGLDEVGAQV